MYFIMEKHFYELTQLKELTVLGHRYFYRYYDDVNHPIQTFFLRSSR